MAPGSEGDWASIDGVVERIAAGHVQIRGEVAFRVAKVEKGTLQGGRRAATSAAPASRRSGAWPKATIPATACARRFDLVYEKPAEKKPVPAQPKRG